MRYAIALLIAVLATIGLSAPTRTLQPRGCTTITPSSMQGLLSTDPTNGFTNEGLHGPGGSGFNIFQHNSEANHSYQMLQFVDFEVPPGSYGCSLYVTDAAHSVGYSLLTGHEPSPNPGMAKVAVRALVANALSLYPTYNDVQNIDPSLISAGRYGTFSIGSGTVPSVINSRACPPAMSNGQDGHLQFVFELDGNDVSHSRYFNMLQRAAGAGGPLNGLYMTFNC